MRALSLRQANTIITATFDAAKKHKCRPMSAIVLDAGGRVKAFQKEDGASMLRFEVCYGKAYASLALGRPSRLVLQKAREKPLFMQSIDNLADYPLFLEGGGQLIRDKESGEVVGAVGVTGDVNEMDDICAIAGMHAAGFRADADFDDPEQIRTLSIIAGPPLADPRKPAPAAPRAAHGARAGRNGSRNRSGRPAVKSGP